MTKQELLDLGLSEEQAAHVLKLNGLAIEGQKDANKQLQAELKTVKDQNATYQTQLKALGDEKPEDLKAKIAELTTANETAAQEHAKQLKDLQVTAAIDRALHGKVHDAELVRNVINRDALVFSEDGKIIGLEDQLADLRANKSFLFVPEQSEEKAPTGGFKLGLPAGEGGADQTAAAISSAFGNVSKD